MAKATSSKTAIVDIDGTPHWDFSQTTAYPVEISGADVFVFLTPYSPSELFSVLKKASRGTGFRRDKRDIELVGEDRSVYIPLFDNHFSHMVGVTSSDPNVDATDPEVQKRYLDKFPDAKSGIVQYGFGGLQLTDKGESDTGDLLDLSAAESSVDVEQELYDPNKGDTVLVRMSHKHIEPTEAQYRKHSAASRQRWVSRKKMYVVDENKETVAGLYDELVLSVEGGAVNGKPCTRETKSEWLDSVPLWHKLWVADNIFAEVTAKNA